MYRNDCNVGFKYANEFEVTDDMEMLHAPESVGNLLRQFCARDYFAVFDLQL